MKEASCPRCGYCIPRPPPGPAPDITLNDAKAILEWHAFNLGAQGEATKAHAIGVLIDALDAPHSTLKSAPPLTPDERPHSCLACDYEATRAVNRNEPPLRLLATCPKVDPRIREDAKKRLGKRLCSCNRQGACYACAVEGTG